MELPIRLIIVFFVAMIVAASIIIFSQDIISSGKERLDKIGKEKEEQENIYVEVSHITTSQVASLVKECYKRYKDEGFVRKPCFSVLSLNNAENIIDVNEIAALDLDNNPETEDVNANFGPNDAALFISYDGVSGKVEVK